MLNFIYIFNIFLLIVYDIILYWVTGLIFIDIFFNLLLLLLLFLNNIVDMTSSAPAKTPVNSIIVCFKKGHTGHNLFNILLCPTFVISVAFRACSLQGSMKHKHREPCETCSIKTTG